MNDEGWERPQLGPRELSLLAEIADDTDLAHALGETGREALGRLVDAGCLTAGGLITERGVDALDLIFTAPDGALVGLSETGVWRIERPPDTASPTGLRGRWLARWRRKRLTRWA